jgi:hypothetical protein
LDPFVVGLLTFGFVWAGQEPPGIHVDFDYLWAAGRATWSGQNPYAYVQELISQGRLHVPLYYPATTAVLLAPVAPLSRQLAVSLFTALGMALLCHSVSGYRRWIVLSPSAFTAVLFGHWSPWLTAAVGLPWLGFVWSAKPNIGLALFASWPNKMALYGGLSVLVLSLLLYPSWPVDWMEAVRGAPQYGPPVTRAGGFLLLLAFLRWRAPEARVIGLLALIPHTTTFPDLLPLMLVPQTKRRFFVLMGLSWMAALYVRFVLDVGPLPADEALSAVAFLKGVWPLVLVFLYLPALAMALFPPRMGTCSTQD